MYRITYIVEFIFSIWKWFFRFDNDFSPLPKKLIIRDPSKRGNTPASNTHYNLRHFSFKHITEKLSVDWVK